MGIDGSEIKRNREKEDKKAADLTEASRHVETNEIAPKKTTTNHNIKDCPACGKSVSKKAESCPHCGEPFTAKAAKAPRTKKSIGCVGAILVILFLGFIGSQLAPNNSPPSSQTAAVTEKVVEKKEKSPEELRTEHLKKCFSVWNGSHINTEALIKKAMNDPDSYKHDETRYNDMKDHLIIITSYRGKNKFGGVVKNWIKVKTDANSCEVLGVIEQGH